MALPSRPSARGRNLPPVDNDKAIRMAVVDDDVDIRTLLKLNCDVDPRFELVGEASDGVQAVELITAIQPEVIILDLDMPRRSGLEAMKVIREVLPEAKVVVFSARYDKYDADDLVAGHANLYVDKSRPVAELLNEIHRLSRGERD